MYYDEKGNFKGEALVLYFKEGSVDLAIRLLDDTELEYGAGVGNMNVKVAEYSKPEPESGAKMDAPEAESEGSAPVKEKRKLGREEKLKMSKRIKTLQK
jgi:HIV Tat-specific factor 1